VKNKPEQDAAPRQSMALPAEITVQRHWRFLNQQLFPATTPAMMHWPKSFINKNFPVIGSKVKREGPSRYKLACKNSQVNSRAPFSIFHFPFSNCHFSFSIARRPVPSLLRKMKNDNWKMENGSKMPDLFCRRTYSGSGPNIFVARLNANLSGPLQRAAASTGRPGSDQRAAAALAGRQRRSGCCRDGGWEADERRESQYQMRAIQIRM
jgi:hypothetical protein